MALQILNNLESLLSFRTKLNEMFAVLFSPAGLTMYNDDTIVASLAIAGQWYALEHADLLPKHDNLFTFSEGVATYIGVDTLDFSFNGSANISASKVSEITFGLFKNDDVDPEIGATTPVDAATVGKKLNIGIATSITLETGDEVRVKARSDSVNTNLSVYTISTVLSSH